MKNIIWYYYKIRVDSIDKEQNYYKIISDGEIYIFKELLISEENLKRNLEILNLNQIRVHQLLFNNKGEVVTEYEKKNYILMKVIEEYMAPPLNFSRYEVGFLPVTIGKLWEKKIDYYMLQIRELGIEKELLVNAFNYYVGMAENAISICNRISDKNVKIINCIQHIRVGFPYDYITYYDPTEMVIDTRIRDVAELFKSVFFKNEVSVYELVSEVEKNKYDQTEINILFSRLLYPTYFFDIFEDLITNDESNEKILEIIEKQEKYEKILSNFYENIKQKYEIYEINWIKKEHVTAQH